MSRNKEIVSAVSEPYWLVIQLHSFLYFRIKISHTLIYTRKTKTFPLFLLSVSLLQDVFIKRKSFQEWEIEYDLCTCSAGCCDENPAEKFKKLYFGRLTKKFLKLRLSLKFSLQKQPA